MKKKPTKTRPTLVDGQDITFNIPGHIVCVYGKVRDYGADGICIMQNPGVIKDRYTAEELAAKKLLDETFMPLSDGDEVLFEGKLHRVKVLGDYSDAGRLVAI